MRKSRWGLATQHCAPRSTLRRSSRPPDGAPKLPGPSSVAHAHPVCLTKIWCKFGGCLTKTLLLAMTLSKGLIQFIIQEMAVKNHPLSPRSRIRRKSRHRNDAQHQATPHRRRLLDRHRNTQASHATQRRETIISAYTRASDRCPPPHRHLLHLPARRGPDFGPGPSRVA